MSDSHVEMFLIEQFKTLLDSGLQQRTVLEVLGERAIHSDWANLARDQYTTEDVEVDDRPMFSESDSGVWVSAWVFLYREEYKPEEEDRSHESHLP